MCNLNKLLQDYVSFIMENALSNQNFVMIWLM